MEIKQDKNLIAYVTTTDNDSLNELKLKTIREYGVMDENIIREYIGTRQSCRKNIEIVKNILDSEKTIVLYDFHDLGGSYKTILYELKSIHKTQAKLVIINNSITLGSEKYSPKTQIIIWETLIKIVEMLKTHEQYELLKKQNDGRKQTAKKLGRRSFKVNEEFISYCVRWKHKEITIEEVLAHFDIKRATLYNYAKELSTKGLL